MVFHREKEEARKRVTGDSEDCKLPKTEGNQLRKCLWPWQLVPGEVGLLCFHRDSFIFRRGLGQSVNSTGNLKFSQTATLRDWDCSEQCSAGILETTHSSICLVLTGQGEAVSVGFRGA